MSEKMWDGNVKGQVWLGRCDCEVQMHTCGWAGVNGVRNGGSFADKGGCVTL